VAAPKTNNKVLPQDRTLKSSKKFDRGEAMKRHVVQLMAVLAACMLIVNIALAQTNSGEIRGRVVDAADAVVVEAQVTLTNQLTGDDRNAKTDKAGEFVFVAVQPGTYSVSVQAAGFKKFEKRDLVLNASDRLSAGTLTLSVGGVTETVSVEAAITPVQTESAERSSLVDAKELANMMTIGRDPLSTIRLLPGVVNDGGGSGSMGTESAGTISGVRESSNAVSIDGVNGNPRGDGNKLDTPVSMDAVQEIKVMLNSYQAEYGSSAGAIINLVTKQGGQQFHGSGYYYGRNEAFNANSWLNNYKGDPRGVYRYNTAGYTLGGPFYIPKVFNKDKNKLFFFFNQEYWPTKTNSGLQKYLMPTAAQRNGDFTSTYSSKDPGVDKATGLPKPATKVQLMAPYANNIIPAAAINKNFQTIMNSLPLPTIDCTPYGGGGKPACPLTSGTSGSPYNYAIMAPRNEPTNETLLRLDYNLNDKWHMYFRGQYMPKENSGLTSTTDKMQWGIPMYYRTPGENAGYNLTYVASPTLVNEFTVGYASWKELNDLVNQADYAKITKSGLGVTLGQLYPDGTAPSYRNNPLGLIPRITGLGSGNDSNNLYQLSSAPSWDFDNRFPMQNMTGTWEFTDGVTKIWNRHTFKVGAYFQAGRYLQRHIGSVFSGNFDFTTSTTNPFETGYGYADMLTGAYNKYSEGTNVVDYAPHWYILEWYLQDHWKVRPNLSVDFGMRFTFDLPTVLAKGMGAGWVDSRYSTSQVPALYNGVPYSSFTNTNDPGSVLRNKCKGIYKSPSRCAVNPNNPSDVLPDTAIGTFVTPFSYPGMVVNTDPNYPTSLRWSNGLLPAPRFGISWDPFGDGKTAVRFGAGLYFNSREGGGTVGDYSLIPPLTRNLSVGVGQVIDGQNFTANCTPATCFGSGIQAINATPQDTRILEPHRAVESTLGTNFGIQRNVGLDTVVEIGYVGTFGRHLNQQYNLNAVPYGATVANLDVSQTGSSDYNCYYSGSKVTGTNTITGFCQQKTQSDNYVRPFPGYAALNLRDYGATSNYNSLQTSVNRRFTKGLQFGVSYTWSKTMTNQDTVNGAVANYQDMRWWNYGEASFDRTHNLVFHWTAAIPKASRLWNNRLLKGIGDNWEWSGIAQFVSGAPSAVTMGGNPNLTYGGDGARILLFNDPYIPNADVHKNLQFLNNTPGVWVMPCAPGMSAAIMQSSGCALVDMQTATVGGKTYQYVQPNPNTPGWTRVNNFHLPGINNWDMGLQKNVFIGERVKLAFRVEAYNVFNHVSFTGVDTTYTFDTSSSSGTGALKSGTTFGQVNGERGPRRLQLTGRITF
jgi:hypothetical protein